MATIVTRAAKGSPLTHVEVDANFTNLNTDKVETSALATVATSGAYADLTGTPTAYTDAAVDTHLNTGTATTGEVLSWTGTDYDWIAAGGGGSALELYAENPVSPTAPSATGNNAVAIGNNAQAVTGANAMALGNSRASGTDSFAAAIANNTATYGATGANSIAMGSLAQASNSDALALGDRANSNATASTAIGRQASATGNSSVAIGSSSAASQNNTVAIGVFAAASGLGSISVGNYSTAGGDRGVSIGTGANSSIVGKFAYSNGGIAFGGYFPMHQTTSDATPTALTTDGSAAGNDDQIILPNSSAYSFSGTIVARQKASDGTASAAWEIKGLIRREANAASTVLVNSALTVLDNTPAWGLALTADTTNGGLKIEATGAAATNIRWVATINTSEVTYA